MPLFPLLLLLVAVQTGSPQTVAAQSGVMVQTFEFVGRWRVKFTMVGIDKNLILNTKAGGVGSFLLLDTAPGDKPAANPEPATWSQLTNNRVSFSGEVDLPIGTCCRERGTLVFKGRFKSRNSISGKLIFVTSVDEEESPYQYHSVVGIFTATRLPGRPSSKGRITK